MGLFFLIGVSKNAEDDRNLRLANLKYHNLMRNCKSNYKK